MDTPTAGAEGPPAFTSAALRLPSDCKRLIEVPDSFDMTPRADEGTDPEVTADDSVGAMSRAGGDASDDVDGGAGFSASLISASDEFSVVVTGFSTSISTGYSQRHDDDNKHLIERE